MGFFNDINPFAEGHILGPAHPVGGQRPGREVDPLTGERGAQHRQDFLYGGSETGAQDFNAQTQGIAQNYGQQMTGAGGAYAGQLQNTGYQYGTGLDNMGHGQYGTGAALLAMGENAYAQADPNAYVDPSGLANSNANAANMGGAADALMGLDFNGPSAAEAQLNAGAAQAANQNLSLAQSGRGMGGSAAARRAAMRQNAQIMGRTNADAAVLRANEEATRRQQRMQAVQSAAGIYGNAGQLQQGNAAYLSGAREAAMQNAQNYSLGLTNAGLGSQQAGASTVQNAASTQLGAQQAAAGTQLGAMGNAATTELAGQQLANQTNQAALAGTMGYEGDMTGRRGQDLGAQAATAQNQQQNQSALLGLAATGVGALAMASDRTAKTDIKRIPVDARIFGGNEQQESQAGTFAAQLADWKRSMGQPEDKPLEESASKRYMRHITTGQPMQWNNTPARFTQQYQAPLTGINAGQAAGAAAARAGGNARASATPYGGPSEAEYQSEQAKAASSSDGGSYGGVDVAALDEANRRARSNYGESSPSPEAAARTIDEANPYTFLYKDPERHGQGQRVGVMAQDLEKTPAGAAAVMRSPDGTRMVDTGELSTINTAALHNQQKRQDRVEDSVSELRRALGLPEEPDYAALDDSYRREAAGWR